MEQEESLDDNVVARLLRQNPANHPRIPTRTVKIYVCCNKKEFDLERNLLWSTVLPDLQRHCLNNGFDIQLIDMNHGCYMDYEYDSHLFQQFLSALHECHETSEGPFFLGLVGSSYGMPVLPVQLSDAEFSHIRNEAFGGGKDVKLLDEWYIKNENIVPAVYSLVQPSDVFKHINSLNPDLISQRDKDIETWKELYGQLLDIIQHGAKVAHEEGLINQAHPNRQKRFFSSAMEQQIEQAMKLDSKRCVMIFRYIEGKENEPRTLAGKEKDLKNIKEATKRKSLKELQENICSSVPESNLHSFTIRLKKESDNAEVIYREHEEYLENFVAECGSKLKGLIKSHMGDKVFSSSLERNIYYEHLVHCNQLKANHELFSEYGLENVLEKVQFLLNAAASGDHSAIVLKAPSAMGKSVLTSRVYHEMTQMFGQSVIVLPQFIGLTPESQKSGSLLLNLCLKMNFVLGQRKDISSHDHIQLAVHLSESFIQFSKRNDHLVILLDALDKISDMNTQNEHLLWLSMNLPPKVHIVISYSSEHDQRVIHRIEQTLISKESIIVCPTWSNDRIKKLFNSTLASSKRTLRKSQESAILESLYKRGCPLLVRLVAKQCERWNSNFLQNGRGLPISVSEYIHRCFENLEREFGQTIIAQLVCYISLSKNGLSEMEILDLLSSTNSVILSVFPAELPMIVRFPFCVWTIIKQCLGSLLTTRFIENRSVITWSHHVIADTLYKMYVKKSDTTSTCHNDIAQLFMETWIQNKPIVARERNIIRIENAQRRTCIQPLVCSEYEYNMRRINELWHQQLCAIDAYSFKSTRGEKESLKDNTMCDFEYILSMLHSSSVETLVDCFDTINAHFLDAELFLLSDCLKIMTTTLTVDPLQLASELIGRLRQIKECYPSHIDNLVTQCMQWCDSYDEPLIVPLSTWLTVPVFQSMLSFENLICSHVSALAHNNQYVFCSSHDSDIDMYHIPTKKHIRVFKGHLEPVNCIVVSQQCKFIVSSSNDKTIRIWDVASGDQFHQFSPHIGPVTCLLIDRHEDVLVSGSEDTDVVLLNIHNGEILHVLKGHTKAVTAIAFNSSESILAAASLSGTVILWCMDDQSQLLLIEASISSPILSMAVSQDNTFLMIGCENGVVSVLSFITGSVAHHIKEHQGKIYSLAVSSDCHHLVVGCEDGYVYLYNLRSAELLQRFHGSGSAIYTVSISSDEQFIFASSTDSMHVWSFGKKFTCDLSDSNHSGTVLCIAVSNDGKRALSGGVDCLIKVWNLEISDFMENFTGHKGNVTCVTFANNDEYAVSGSDDCTIKVWSLTLACVITNYMEHEGVVKDVKVLTDNVRVLSVDLYDNVRIWKAESGQTFVSVKVSSAIYTVSCDSKYVISGKGDNKVRIWHLDDGNNVQTIAHADRITCIKCSKDNRYVVTGSADKSVKIWELQTGKITQILVGHESVINCLEINCDQNEIISAAHDRMILTWDIDTGSIHKKMVGHTDNITQLRLTVDWSTLLSASKDNTIRVWTMKTGQLLTMFDLHLPVLDFEMTHDASCIVVQLENDNHVPLLCLHNTPVGDADVMTTSDGSVNKDDRIHLPVKPKPPLNIVPSVEFMFQPRSNISDDRRSLQSSMPDIRQGSPIISSQQCSDKSRDRTKLKKVNIASKFNLKSKKRPLKSQDSFYEKSQVCQII